MGSGPSNPSYDKFNSQAPSGNLGPMAPYNPIQYQGSFGQPSNGFQTMGKGPSQPMSQPPMDPMGQSGITPWGQYNNTAPSAPAPMAPQQPMGRTTSPEMKREIFRRERLASGMTDTDEFDPFNTFMW